jgi:hypothetical protein
MKSIKRGMSCTAGIYPHDSGLDVKVSESESGIKAISEGNPSKISTSLIYIFRSEKDDPRVAFLPLCCTTSDE